MSSASRQSMLSQATLSPRLFLTILLVCDWIQPKMTLRVSLGACLVLCMVGCVAAESTVFAFSSASLSSSHNETLALYARDMREADAAGATFLLFPEFSLFQPTTRAAALVECSNAPQTLAALGAMLAQSQVLQYALVNLCLVERDDNGTRLFNTNFLLSAATGGVAAQYRKTHPWFTHVFDAPHEPDYVVFKGECFVWLFLALL